MANPCLRVVGAGLLVATGGDPSRPLSHRLPDDPDDRLVVPGADHRRLCSRTDRPHLREPACRGRSAAFAVATLGGYLLSLWVGLFGFREVRTSAGILAGVIEVAAFAALGWSALCPDGPRRVAAPATGGTDRLARMQATLPVARWATVALSALAALLLALSLAAPGSVSASTGSSGAHLKLGKVGGVSVLTNAHGYTLYLFVPDPPNKSTCYGTCADYWPPVTGTPTAGTGVTGKLGVIRRSGGGHQVTYDRHPLYTYVGDAAPGQANGNNINLNGGLWQVIVVPG